MVYKFFEKKTGSKTSANEELAKNYTNQWLKNFKRGKVYARFKDSILPADLVEMGSLCSFNRGVKYLIDVFIKHAWVKTLKDKKAKTVLYGFIEIVNECKPKPNKLWVDQGR